MVKSLIRDDCLPMHVNHVQLLILHVRENAGKLKILFYAHVVIFYIENNTEKTYFQHRNWYG